MIDNKGDIHQQIARDILDKINQEKILKTPKKYGQNDKKQTTVTIDIETLEQLNLYCEKYKIKKKDFIRESLLYFFNQSIDITKPSLKSEAEVVLKRLDYIVGILKTQEKEIQKPTCNEVLKMSHNIETIINALNGGIE